MECLIPANETILGILGKNTAGESGRRMIRYCITRPTEDGVLLFHTLTRELLLLDPEEFDGYLTSDYLYKHYFTIPENLDERELVELVRWVRSGLKKKKTSIRSYTILPTTDCNARCFYCYERGCRKISMTRETAEKAADYIIRRCGNGPVRLRWFGGEPLMNSPAIDAICSRLRAAQIPFQSSMTSNGYLFRDDLTARAVKDWNLKQIQITLDGTETVYNRSKAYVDPQGSPFRIVLDNISRLLDAGVSVVIRMNMDLYNREDLLELTRQLASRFENQKGLHAYVSLLFDETKTWEELHTPAQWEQLYRALRQLEELLLTSGLAAPSACRLRRDLPLHYCMADSGESEMILPDGQLGLCEHHTDDEFIGHIDSPHREEAVIASWRERFDPIPECDGCAHYPECIQLKKCSGRIRCFAQSRNHKRWKTETAMDREYRLRKQSVAQEPESGPSQQMPPEALC